MMSSYSAPKGLLLVSVFLLTLPLAACNGGLTEEDRANLQKQIDQLTADKAKLQSDLEALKKSNEPVARIADDTLLKGYAEGAKKFSADLKSYFSAGKIKELAVKAGSTATGTLTQVSETPTGLTYSEATRNQPYSALALVSFELNGVKAPTVLEAPVVADATGAWVFPTTSQVEGEFVAVLGEMRPGGPVPATTPTTSTVTPTPAPTTSPAPTDDPTAGRPSDDKPKNVTIPDAPLHSTLAKPK